jgi:hypothetical protein
MGATAGHLHTLNEKLLTWYKILRNAINKLDRKEEVLLGFTCTSVYPHISVAARHTIQHVFEGEDMVIYRILGRLATDIRVDMILDDYPAGMSCIIICRNGPRCRKSMSTGGSIAQPTIELFLPLPNHLGHRIRC